MLFRNFIVTLLLHVVESLQYCRSSRVVLVNFSQIRSVDVTAECMDMFNYNQLLTYLET